MLDLILDQNKITLLASSLFRSIAINFINTQKIHRTEHVSYNVQIIPKHSLGSKDVNMNTGVKGFILINFKLKLRYLFRKNIKFLRNHGTLRLRSVHFLQLGNQETSRYTSRESKE